MTHEHDDQIASDIDAWAHKRLIQWYDDALSRYEIADIPPAQAYANVFSLMLMTTAKAFAIVSTIPAEEAGEVMTRLIERERKIQAKKETQAEAKA
jgi:hypothetical protein